MIIRVQKDYGYTVMSNHHLQHKELTLKAKGLLSVILSLPENWDYTLEGLAAICKEGYATIKNTIDELKEFGYVEVIKLLPNQTKSGRIEYEYIVHEMPKAKGENPFVEPINEKTRAKKQGVVLQGLEKQGLVFCDQLNTNNQSTNKQSTNNITPISSPEGAKPKRTRQRDNPGSFDTDDFFEAALRRSYGKS